MAGSPIRALRALPLAAAIACACASPAPPPSPTAAQIRRVTPAPTALRPHSPRASTPNATAPASPTGSATAAPSARASGAARTLQSDDGLLTIEVPEGATADPSVLNATARGEADLPVELRGLEVRSAFYELAPADTQFALPVRITRRVSFDDLRLEPSDGVPILLLAIRSADGAWEWLAHQMLRHAEDVLLASGEATHGGTVFAFGGSALTEVGVSDVGPIQIGNALTITATLTLPDGSVDPPLIGSFEQFIGANFVQIGSASRPDSQSLSQAFACAGLGSATVGLRYTVLNLGAEVALFEQLGLAPTITEVEATADLTCGPGITSTP